MLEVLSAEPLLENTAAAYAERPPHRPPTKFEQRGLKLGHGVWDLGLQAPLITTSTRPARRRP